MPRVKTQAGSLFHFPQLVIVRKSPLHCGARRIIGY
jgi:hypothetical protein